VFSGDPLVFPLHVQSQQLVVGCLHISVLSLGHSLWFIAL
jgi:hypothetical protein